MNVKQVKRQKMLVAAKHLFTENGFERTSMQKVADEAGVGVATLFRYFPKKEQLIIELVIEVIEGMLPHFEDINESNRNGYEKMEAILDSYIDYIFTANRQAVTLLENFEYYVTYNPIEDELINTIRSTYIRIGRCVNEAINQGIEDGSISLSGEEKITALTIMNLFGIAIKKHAFTSFLPVEIVPVPKKQELVEVKKIILNYFKKN
ncbi:TetR/AcrR family transcriptional regulator [Solibacillus sp. FSL R7-0682]|uniref:TetR/AcrR family transcriptional regulator n=1 Tax=Solibacillus sp. FSL R7-0682 TaxID=2921690 RepID=UPI0030F858C2